MYLLTLSEIQSCPVPCAMASISNSVVFPVLTNTSQIFPLLWVRRQWESLISLIHNGKLKALKCIFGRSTGIFHKKMLIEVLQSHTINQEKLTHQPNEIANIIYSTN